MSRDTAAEVADIARRRLELLGRELAGARGPDRLPIGPDTDTDTGTGTHTGAGARADTDVDDPGLGTDWGTDWDTNSRGAPDRLAPRPVPMPGRHSRSQRQSLAPRASGWLADRLPVAVQARVSVGAAHVVVVAVVAALALAVTAYVALRSQGSGEPVPLARPAGALVSTAALPSASPTAGAATGTTGGTAIGTVQATGLGTPGVEQVVVDVSGKVRRPGIATLPAGSRVIDAIRKAGGARKGVDLTSINLARLLVDGEQILVGVKAAPGLAASASSSGSGSSTASDGGLVNLNTAGLEQLETLSGVGPVTAQKIMDWRSQHGAFTSVDDLLEVDGIGEKTLAKIAPHVTL